MKRIVVWMLILCMCVGACSACGKKDKKPKKQTTETAENVATPTVEPEEQKVIDVLETMSKVKTGTMELNVNIKQPSAGFDDSEIKVVCQFDQGKLLVSKLSIVDTIEGEKRVVSGENVLVINDAMLSISLGELVKSVVTAMGMSEEELGIPEDFPESISIPLPDEYADVKTSDEVISLVIEAIGDMLAAGEENSGKVTFTKTEQSKTAIIALANFLKNKGTTLVDKSLESSKDIDLNKYVKKLIDFYYKDFEEFLKTNDFPAEELESYVDMLESTDLNGMIEEYRKEADQNIDMTEMAEELKKVAEELRDDIMDGIVYEITAVQKDKTYEAGISIVAKGTEDDGEYSITVKLAEGNVNIPTVDADPKALINGVLAPALLSYLGKAKESRDAELLLGVRRVFREVTQEREEDVKAYLAANDKVELIIPQGGKLTDYTGCPDELEWMRAEVEKKCEEAFIEEIEFVSEKYVGKTLMITLELDDAGEIKLGSPLQ